MKKSFLFIIILTMILSSLLSGCAKEPEARKNTDIPEAEKLQKLLDDASLAMVSGNPDKFLGYLSEVCPRRQSELDRLKAFAAGTKFKSFSQSILSAKRLKDGVVCTVNIAYEGTAANKSLSGNTIRDIYFIFENGVWKIGDYNYYPYLNPTVIAGSDSPIYDAAYLMSEALKSSLRTDMEHLETYGDIILVGTPYDNASILNLEEKGLTPLKVTDDYPGDETGVVQVLSNIEDYRHVILIQGSSTMSAENATRFMTEYLQNNEYLNPGVYFIDEGGLRKAAPLEMNTLVTLDMDKSASRLEEVQRQTEANISVIEQELISEKEQLDRELGYLHSEYMEDYPKVFSRYEFYPEKTPYDSMVLINANLTVSSLCEASFRLPSGNSRGTLYAFAEFADRNIHLTAHADEEDNGLLIGGSPTRTQLFNELSNSFNGLEASTAGTAILRLAGFSSSEAFSITSDKGHGIYLNMDNGYAITPGEAVVHTPELQYPAGKLLSVYNDAAFLSYENDNSNLEDEEISAINARAKELLRQSAKLPKGLPEKTAYKRSELEEKLDIPYSTEDIYGLLRNAFVNDYSVKSFSTLDEARDNLRAAMGRLLAVKCTRFIVGAASRYPGSQFDYASYAAGLINIEHPNAYAEAAETSRQLSELGNGISNLLSGSSEKLEKIISVLSGIEDDERIPDRFFFPDYCMIKNSGSHWDKALLAFGLYSHLTGDADNAYIALGENSSYLVFRDEEQWKYIDCKYNTIKDYADEEFYAVFNKEMVYNRKLNIGTEPDFE